MIKKQPTSLLRSVFSHHDGTVSSGYCRLDRTIHKVYITEFFLAFPPQTPLNSLNDTLIVFDPYANDGGTDAKYTVG